ncbi:MAG: signal peptidase I [Candidatus Limnocylindrales bacterium]
MSRALRRLDAVSAISAVAGLVVAYFVIRTLGMPPALTIGWIAVAVGASLASPLVGLSVLAAIGPFTGALDDDGAVTAVPFLLAGVGGGVLLRASKAAIERCRQPEFRQEFRQEFRSRLRERATPANVTIVLALLLAAGTAIGVLHTWRFSAQLGRASVELWVPGIGGGIAVFLAAAWCARRGETVPLLVTGASIALAAAVSILDFVTDGGVNASFLGWLVHDALEGQPRLGGVILAPNAAATIFLIGAAIASSFAAVDGDRRLRVAGAVATAICLAAIVLTYSRSALIATLVLFAVIAWRTQRWRGIAALGVAALTFGVLYVVAFQGDLLRDVPAIADQQRLDAWGAASRMWLDRPLYGVGFRAFEWLHAEYGSVLNAPHNEWLRLFAEEGILVGLVGIAFMAGVVRTARESVDPIATAVLGGSLALAIMATFNNPFFYAQVNVPAFTLLGFALFMARPKQPQTDSTDAPRDGAESVAIASRRPAWVTPVLQTLALTLIAFLSIQTFIVRPYEVVHESMHPTLEEGQYVLVDRLTPRFDDYSRGDVVVFNPVRRAGSCSAPASQPLDRGAYIKRVIGEPGDSIELREGRVYVDGELLVEPYVQGLPTGPGDSTSTWVVPADRLFVMGDNRPDSIDSRSDAIGLICLADVVGRAFLRYWPLSELGVVARPSDVAIPTTPDSPPSLEPTLSTEGPTNPPPPSSIGPSPRASERPTAVAVEHLRVEVIERRPHDLTSYTEGLVLVDGRLFESSAYGDANLREVDPRTGAVVRAVAIESGYFAEGIAVVEDRLIQLTWQEHTALVYALRDFSRIGSFSYDTEGWGLCDDGTRLVMSDGTDQLYFRDRTTFDLLGTVAVTLDGEPLTLLNELECVNGRVFANVWHSSDIVRIDPSGGFVDAVIDASGLLAPHEIAGDEEAVLNGIAFDATGDTFLLTGKLWPSLFVVRVVPSH